MTAREPIFKAWIFRGHVYAMTRKGKYKHPYQGSSDKATTLLKKVQDTGSINLSRWLRVDTSKLDITPLLVGRSNCYAVPGGNRLKVQIREQENGDLHVYDASIYGKGRCYGVQKENELYEGEIVEELTQILEDPLAAATAYGHLVGHCGICRRPLERRESIERGMGIKCYEKLTQGGAS